VNDIEARDAGAICCLGTTVSARHFRDQLKGNRLLTNSENGRAARLGLFPERGWPGSGLRHHEL